MYVVKDEDGQIYLKLWAQVEWPIYKEYSKELEKRLYEKAKEESYEKAKKEIALKRWKEIIIYIEKEHQKIYINFKWNKFLLKKCIFDSDYEILIDFLIKSPWIVISKELINEKLKRNISEDLQRMITHLWFKGILRELFFLWTNKNTLLFKNFITAWDLKKINITENDIKEYLTKKVIIGNSR